VDRDLAFDTANRLVEHAREDRVERLGPHRILKLAIGVEHLRSVLPGWLWAVDVSIFY
jgi:hypothetical protein